MTDLPGESETGDAGPDGDAPTEPIEAAPDADVDLSPEVPEVKPPPGCDPLAPFDTVTSIGSLADQVPSTYRDITARLSQDELKIFFGSNRFGQFSLFRGQRATRTEPFTNIEMIPGVSSGFTTSPTVTADGLTMYLDSDRSGKETIFMSKRDDVTSPWSTPVSLAAEGAFPATTVNDSGPYVLPTGKVLYFHSWRSADRNQHIFRAERVGNGFPTSTEVTATVSNAWDIQPVVANDELSLYFASDRRVRYHFDIWVSTRQTTSDDFGSPVYVASVNTEADEFPGWISPDSCRLYLERGDETTGRIYVATRQLGGAPASADGGADAD